MLTALRRIFVEAIFAGYRAGARRTGIEDAECGALVQRVNDRCLAWLRRRGYLDERRTDERSTEPPAQTALDACAAIAIGRGQVASSPNADEPDDDPVQSPDKPVLPLAVDKDGFNLHAGQGFPSLIGLRSCSIASPGRPLSRAT